MSTTLTSEQVFDLLFFKEGDSCSDTLFSYGTRTDISTSLERLYVYIHVSIYIFVYTQVVGSHASTA